MVLLLEACLRDRDAAKEVLFRLKLVHHPNSACAARKYGSDAWPGVPWMDYAAI